MSDLSKLEKVLADVGVPHEVWHNGEYNHITFEGTASDNEFTIVFKNENYEYTE